MASIDIHICHEKYSLLHFAWAPTALCSLLTPCGYRSRLLAIRSWSPRYLSEHRSLFAHFLVLNVGFEPHHQRKQRWGICIGWVGSTFKLVIVSLSRWVREIWFGRQNGPIFVFVLVYLSRRFKCTIVIMRCPYSVRPSVVNFSHFRLLLWKRWTELNETLQEARSQRLLPSLCFSDRSEKQDGRPGLLLAETFSTYPLQPLNGIKQNLTESKI